MLIFWMIKRKTFIDWYSQVYIQKKQTVGVKIIYSYIWKPKFYVIIIIFLFLALILKQLDVWSNACNLWKW